MYLPTSPTDLIPRQYYGGYGCGYYNNCHSSWYNWGRWVLTGILIFFGLLFLAIILFCTSRRRRRARRNQTAAPMVSQPPPTGNYANNGYYNQTYAPPGPAPGYWNEYGGYGQQAGVAQPGQTYQPYK